jgi:hypothetical protein
MITNNVAIDFIKSKQETHNWDNNQNFYQDSIPVPLRKYFTPVSFADNLNLNQQIKKV